MKTKKRCTSYYLYLLLFFSSTILLAQNQATFKEHIFPEGINKEIYFGMPLSEFEQIIKSVELVEENSFRIVFLENLTTSEIQKIVYYFDLDGEKPLYEIINYPTQPNNNQCIKHTLFSVNQILIKQNGGFARINIKFGAGYLKKNS